MQLAAPSSTRRDLSDSSKIAELKDYYKTSRAYCEHLTRKGTAYFRDFVFAVCKYSSETDCILDLGCGTGESTRELELHKRRVIGTDLSPLFLHSQGFPKSGSRLVVSDACELPFADSTFDVVCAMEFIEHVWPVDTVLREMDRTLKLGGRIIIASPNLVSPLWPIRDIASMLAKRQFRPPFYRSYGEAARFFHTSLVISIDKLLSPDSQFVQRTPDLDHANDGGDYDSVYKSNARDLMLFFRHLGYTVRFADRECDGFRSRFRNFLANTFGSMWISFILVAVKES